MNVAQLPPAVGVRETPVAIGASGDTLRGVRLEVANGVGITNLARRTANRLAAGTGVITARLTNARPYRQMKTEIQFGAGQDALAKALQTRLPLTATLAAAQMQGNVQLRLVLGHDLTGRAIAAWLEGRDAQTAALPSAVPADVASAVTGGGGWMWG
ncbi:LytR C-terminal domain-containing protein [Polaromonas sp. P1(28)-13]|nr:LytR C-terminal domain-containing protein [Polaromonas sp. P1(28)-13]